MPWLRGQPPRASGLLFLKLLHDIPLVTKVGMTQGLIGSDSPLSPMLLVKGCSQHGES